MGQREPGTITALCLSLGYSRQAFYQRQQQQQNDSYKQEILLQEIHGIRAIQKRLGGRKLFYMLADFMQAHAIEMGRDMFFDFLSVNGLLVRRRKRNKPVTTNSFHRYKMYKNLTLELIPTAPNQLWVSDITYITLENAFAYLSLITDVYSRKIVGFCLHKTLEAVGSIKALKMAFKNTGEVSRLIHHSDRGVQYCCNAYVKLLHKRKVKISMTEHGDPLENAIAERVNGILKDELLEEEYTYYEQAQNAIAVAISIYNHQRPHSSIDYLTPGQAYLKAGILTRKWKNYYQKERC